MQLTNLSLECLDNLARAIHGSAEFGPFSLPPIDSFLLCSEAPLFRLDLVANFAFSPDGDSLHDQSHAASFPRSVFFIAMLPEVSPLVVAAGVLIIVEETHVLSS